MEATVAPRILSLGSINADFQVSVPEPLGERETLAVAHLSRLGGGKAANVALVARRMGHPAVLLGRVGDDDLAPQALSPLREAGVDVSMVRTGREEGTGMAMVAVPPDGKKNIVAAGRANVGFDDADIEAMCRVVRAAPEGSVLVADYEVTPEAVRRAMREARAWGLKVVVDPSLPDKVPVGDLRLVDALTPNEEEALALAGVEGQGHAALAEAARTLADRGPSVVCIKLKDGGCLVHHEGEAWHVPSAPVEQVVDTTGAGDAFTGAFAVSLMEGCQPLEAARRAVAAGEVAVTRHGAQPSYPERDELDRRLMAAPRRPAPWGHTPPFSGGQV